MRRVNHKGATDNSIKLVKRAHAATYGGLLADVARVIEAARHAAVRSVNAVMTSTYWLIGRRIVEQEQQGAVRAGYGDELLKRLARDLSKRFGRGFSERNLEQMRAFYLGWPNSQTASANLIDLSPDAVHLPFPLSWSHYARLLAVRNPHARTFYEAEALRGGWTIRQLDRQIQSQFYERMALSRDKTALLRKGASPQASDSIDGVQWSSTVDIGSSDDEVYPAVAANPGKVAVTFYTRHYDPKATTRRLRWDSMVSCIPAGPTFAANLACPRRTRSRTPRQCTRTTIASDGAVGSCCG